MESSPYDRCTRSSTTPSRCAAAVLALAVFVGPQPSLAGEPIDEVTGARRVCEAGPTRALARALARRADAAVLAAGVLPNPELSIEHERTLAGPREHETVAGIRVPLGIGGRRFLLQDAAAARRDEALAEAGASLVDQAIAFREAYVAAVLDQARLEVVSVQQRALDAMAATVRGLAKAGEGAGYDVLRQEMQARLHRRALAAAEARAEGSRALLEAWLGQPIVLPQGDLDALAGGARTGAAEAAIPPRVRALEAASRASAIEARAARRRWVPDLEVFAGYKATSGEATATGHGIALGLAVPLTFFDRGQGEAAQAEAEQAVTAASAAALRREASARTKAATARLSRLATAFAELDRAVADASVLEGKSAQLYAAGEASIAELLDAFRASEEARLARIDAAGEVAAARIELMRATGRLFDPGLERACATPPGVGR